MISLSERLDRLASNLPILRDTLRGIEKEGLRVHTGSGKLSQQPHPKALGSALAHPGITTDYSEALLELVTGTHNDVASLQQELTDIHAFVSQHLDNEVMWNQSMPALLPPVADIPVGWYGTSNSGMLKHVYRLGLAERYGKPMQCIAGIHYNFSVPDAFWDLLGIPAPSPQEQRSTGYMALVRNFMRFSWLLMYLFGGSPAVSKNFLEGVSHQLDTLDADTLYLPWATSLRMSDIGYQTETQAELQLCYNDLDTFLARMYNAVTTPWPDYEAIGTHRDGKWIQLNTNVLQIENEYYSSIRPKRVTGRCERPATALARRGIQYVEVRCLDVDPYSPVGISSATCHFLDAFLLYCAVQDSPDFPDGGFCRESRDNFNLVVKEGRRPGLMLSQDDQPISLQDWAADIITGMQPYARILDAAYDTDQYTRSLTKQEQRVADVSLTPSAKLLDALTTQSVSFHDYTLRQSLAHQQTLLRHGLEPATLKAYQEAAKQSFAEQERLETSDTESFDEYVARFHAALNTAEIEAATFNGAR